MAAVLGATLPSQALDFDFSGTFHQDNDVVGLGFVVGVPSTVTVFSSSWLSGNPPAGFDPILDVWDSAGNRIAQQDDGPWWAQPSRTESSTAMEPGTAITR